MDNRELSLSAWHRESSGPITRSKRSGGPQTAEGKAKSSKNALKTGVYSAMPLLPEESVADFEELVSVFCHDFRAIGPVETMYVQQLAGLTWRRIRLERLEHRVTLDRLERYPTLEEFTQVNLNYPNGVEKYLKGLIKIGDDEYSEYREKLKQVKGYQEAGLTLEALKQLESNDSTMFRWISKAASEYNLTNPTAERIYHAESGVEGKTLPLLELVLGRVRHEIEAILWIPDHQEEIDSAIAKVRDLRRFELMEMNTSKRAFDDLAREFDKTLARLRKQQEWRLRQGKVIDITPTAREVK